MPTLREKACQYYRGQDIRIINAITPEGEVRPIYVEAIVRGYHGFHQVRLESAVWTCSCSSAEDCAHRASVQMVTGYPSSAAAKAGQR